MQRSKSDLILFFLAVTLLGMVWSKFLISQGIIWLSVVSLLDYDPKSRFRIRWSRAWLSNIQNWKTYLPALSVILLFLPIFISGIYSENWELWLERVRIKLPLFFLPIVFLGIPILDRKRFLQILYFFIYLMIGSALFAVARYFFNFDAYNDLIRTGQAIPVPLNHIRFSLLLCCAVLAGFYVLSQNSFFQSKTERYILLFFLLLGIISLHILSVRSGIFTFYCCSFILIIKEIWQTEHRIGGLGALLLLVLIPLLAYYVLPGFKSKVEYMKWDFLQFQQNIGSNYSDSERLISIKAGWETGKESPVFGVGAGDAKDKIDAMYREKFPSYPNPKLPHNQFVMTFVATGCIGLIALVLGLFYSLFSSKNYRNTFFLLIHILVFLSFMVECTLETSQGVALYSVFWLLGYIDLWKTKIIS